MGRGLGAAQDYNNGGVNAVFCADVFSHYKTASFQGHLSLGGCMTAKVDASFAHYREVVSYSL